MSEGHLDLPKIVSKRGPAVVAEEIIADARAEAARIIAEAKASGGNSGAPAAPAPPPSTELERQKPTVLQDRVWITLSENPNIPRGGQFFGVNGAGFLLRPGQKAYVPKGLIDVLENAVEGYPVVDPDTLQITEYRNRLRYPYTTHASA